MTVRLALIVEDDQAIARLLIYYLREAGWHPIHANNGLLALQLFAQQTPALVLLDVMLPDLSGWELCAMMRQSSTVPIVMLTGKCSDQDIVYGLNLGADDYLGKPFSKAQLLARIEAVMRRVPAPAPLPEPEQPTSHASTQATQATIDTRHETHHGQHTLRDARVAAHLSLYQIERLTGIRWDYAQAMEQGHFAYVPRPALRDMLLKYCVFLQVDARPVFEHARRILLEPPRSQRPAYHRLSLALLVGTVVILILLPLILG